MIKSIKNLAKKTVSGGRRIPYRGRRAFEKSRYATETILGEVELVKRDVRGGHSKRGLKGVDYANVVDSSTGKVSKTKILKVFRNPANRDYERRGVITKGCSIETEKGVARVTSRPGQDGVVNAILLK
ncbi:MAG: 30S ribosomal protein S8e [Nitrososphaerales archaeon]